MRSPRRAIADRHLLVVGVAGILGAILLLMLVVFGGRGRVPESKSNTPIAPELLEADAGERDPSKRLVIGERRPAQGDPLQSLQTGRGELEFTNDEGLLAFRYRWEKSDPLETGWNRFTKPQAWVYRSANQLIHIRADEGHFRLAENRQPQAGVLQGNVVMALYEAAGPRAAYAIDTSRDLPVAEFSTSSLNFDAEQLSARTEERVVARTAEVLLVGRGLSLLFNERLGRIEELEIDEREVIVYRRPEGGGDSASAVSGVPEVLPRQATVAPAPTPSSAGAPGAAPHDPARRTLDWSSVTPYRLTLTDEVIIEQGEAGAKLTIRGRDLVADFTLERGSAGGRLTGAPSSSLPSERTPDPAGEAAADGTGRHHAAHQRWIALAAIPIAQPARLPRFLGADIDVSPSDIHITGTGRLTLAPLEGTPENLHGPDDLYATLGGDPVRVELGEFYAIGDHLEYSRSEAVARLECSRGQPLEAGVPGGARLLSVFPFEYQLDPFDETGRTRGVLQGSGTLIGLAPPERLDPPAEAPPGSEPPIPGLPVGFSVNWLDDFTIEFAPDEARGGLGRIASATFSGAVHVDDPQGYSLDSQQLRLGFKDQERERSQVIDTITASGDAVLRSAEGNISGDELFVQFREDAQGTSYPGQLTVTGRGRVVDAGGSIEAQYIQADLVQGSLASAEALPTLFGGALQGEGDEAGKPRSLAVTDLLAQGAVVLSLENDVKAFADRLDVDARTDTAVLTGENVIVSDPSLKVMGRHAEITNISSREGNRIARFLGAGTLTWFKLAREEETPGKAREGVRPVTTPAEMRDELRRRLEGERETPPDSPRDDSPPGESPPDVESVTVDWEDGLTFEEQRGLITFEGDVDALSEPNPRETDRMTGQWLQVELTEPLAASAEPDAPKVRRLRRMTLLGRGDEQARIEAQRFADDSRTERELLLAIGSEIIEYTEATELFEAIGEGWMLVVDSRREEAPAAAGEAAPLPEAPVAQAEAPPPRDPSQAAVKFSGPGETDFSWTGQLSLQGGSILSITDRVVMRHRPLNQPVLRVDCDRMTAALKSTEAISAMDLSRREGMELTRATAEGNVFLRRLDRSIWADRLSYDAQTLLATIEAFEDNYVVLESDSTGGAVQARRILWDFFTNGITIEGSRVDGPIPAIRE